VDACAGFANSVLQLLVHCAPLRDWAERVEGVVGELEARKGAGSVAVPALVRVFVQLVHDYRHGVGQDDVTVSAWSPFAKPLPPLKLASRLVPTVMPGRKTVLEQQDAQEFLFLLLDSLHAALLDAGASEQDDPARSVYYLSDSDDDGSTDSITSTSGGRHFGATSNSSGGSSKAHANGGAAGSSGADDQWTEIGPASRKSVVITSESTWRDSAISQLLRGRMRSTLKRRANSSVSMEPFFALSLEPLLTGAAAAAALPEKRRQGVSAPTCTLMQLLKAYLEPERVTTVSNNAAVAREKQTSLEQLPSVLLIHIARFAFVGGATRKLDTHVEFGAQLEVPLDLFAVHAAPAAAPQYRLRGVVRHHGASATSGHYTACVLVHKPASKKMPAGDEWQLFDDLNVSPISEEAVLASTDTAYLLMFSRV
jgi:ubiquitin carboxyl-terminal hydrolase 10